MAWRNIVMMMEEGEGRVICETGYVRVRGKDGSYKLELR